MADPMEMDWEGPNDFLEFLGGVYHHVPAFHQHQSFDRLREAGPPFYKWIRSTFEIPETAVTVGTDKDEGTLYVGRARHGHNLLPAKVAPTHQGAFVAWQGAEHSKFSFQYEVLVVLRGTVEWVPAHNGDVPSFALPVGRMVDGELAYVGRVPHDGTVTPGRVVASEGACFIPYDGKELAFREYEVLTLS